MSARQRGRRDADFWTHVSDEDLETCIALIEVASGGPFPPWAQELVEEIRARTEARMKRAGKKNKATEQVEAQAAKDFRSLLASSWDRADAALRNSLRTVAAALGLSVPAERRPLRRTRPAPDEQIVSSTSNARSEIAAERAAKAERPEVTEPVAPPDDDYDYARGEDVWEPCSSLFDALHAENRGWD